MNKTIKFAFSFVAALLLVFPHITPDKKVYASDYINGATSEIVVEKNSERVLYEKNSREKKYPASTTKILTAITVIENCDVNALVTVKKETTGIEGSSIYLEEGETLTVKELLYGLMLRSGNDCAETLAVYCSDNIGDFARLMNETAKKAGAHNSNFTNPHGLHDDNHYTTAYDLALISCYAMKNPVFRQIVSTKAIDVSFSTRNSKRRLINKNKMLNMLDGCTGIKTGYTKKAGRCLVTSCLRNGEELVCVVLNCAPMWEVSQNLIETAFSRYKNYTLVDKNDIIGFVECDNYEEKIPLYIKNDIILPLTEEEFSSIEIKYDYPARISEKRGADEEIGLIKIYSENNLLFSEKIYTLI